MISCIIVDDEKNAVTSLELQLATYSDTIRITQTFTQPEAALAFLDAQPVDMIFVDIEMPGINGLQFAERVESLPCEIVFTTAFSQYGIDAVKRGALDYLLKPIDEEDLKLCIEKAARRLESKRVEDRISDVIERLTQKPTLPHKIKIATEGRVHYIKPEAIVYCQADGSYTDLFLNDRKKLTVSQRLKKIEEILPPSLFYRVHHSYVVNVDKIEEFNRSEGYIVLENGIKVPVSRQKRTDFLENI